MTQIDAVPITLRRLQPLRVLVAGGDRRFLRVTSFLLGRKGYEVVHCGPLEAVAAAERHRADVVLLEAGNSKAGAAKRVAALSMLGAAPGILIVTDDEEGPPWVSCETVPKWTSLSALVERIEAASIDRPQPIHAHAPRRADFSRSSAPVAREPVDQRTWSITAVAAAVLLIGLAILRYGMHGDTLIAVFLIAVLVAVSRTDLDRRVIPNRIVIPAWLIVLASNTALHPNRWAEWLLASFGAGLVFFLLNRIYPGGLGMGDVKLVLLLGAALGSQIVPALMIGTGSAAVLSALILLRHGLSARKQTIPLGPFLATGAIIDLLLL